MKLFLIIISSFLFSGVATRPASMMLGGKEELLFITEVDEVLSTRENKRRVEAVERSDIILTKIIKILK
jgi:hypothetical protein